MFFIDLEQGASNKDILGIELLLHARVKFEMPYAKKEIVQCYRCQRYGHSKAYCQHPYRCVKCAQNHPTSNCNRNDQNAPAKCTLCNGAHSANYRGCAVYKELQFRKFGKTLPRPPTGQQARPNKSPVSNLSEFPRLDHSTRQRMSFAQVVRAVPNVSDRDPRQFNRPQTTTTHANANQDTHARSARRDIHRSVAELHPPPPRFDNTSPYGQENRQTNDGYINRLENILLEQTENQRKLSEDLRTMINLLTALITKLH